MKQTGNQTFIKEMNLSIVLNVIRDLGPISRAQIAQRTGLNKATVSALTDTLIEKNLVVEMGPGPSQVGRRPILLRFNADAGYAIGVDIDVQEIRIVLTNFAGQILKRFTCDQIERDSDAFIGTLSDQIYQIQKEVSPSCYGIIGVGVGVPGLVDHQRGIVINAPNLRWENIHLKALLENAIHLPVYVDNEANMGALGEKSHGAGRTVSDLVYVSVSTGIGAGIIQDNKLLHGSNGLAGEFGHITIETHGLRCSCGNKGCLEVYASEQSLLAHYSRLTGEELTFQDILQRAKKGEASAIESFREVGSYLGIGIANIMNGLNPSLVVIGNRMGEAGSFLLEPVLRTVQSRCFIAPYTHIDIRLSELKKDAGALGAAVVVLNNFFAGPMSDGIA